MNRTIAAALLLAAASGIAAADVINVRFTGTGQGHSVKIVSAAYTGNVFAGQLEHQLTNGTGDASALNGTWLTYCVDLSQHVTSTTQVYTVVPVSQMPDSSPMGLAKAEAIRRMYAFANGAQSMTSTSDDMAAAFQLALWEVVTDFNPALPNNNLNVTAGGFKATKTDGSALWSGTQSYLNSLFGAVGTEGDAVVQIIGISNGSAQDQIVPVPTPGALALAGLGGLCVSRRRRT
jgi:MYXO-CTERM domain-containing protein